MQDIYLAFLLQYWQCYKTISCLFFILEALIIIIIIIIMNKLQETMFFRWAPEIYFRYENKARKVMVDFKFDALYQHREPPEVGLVQTFTGNLYWWVQLCVPTLHRECYCTL